ncbi:MAG: cell division protein ZapA [Rhodospirillaceae bacterium]|nr:cell division protein ZapA [Rhodospirillaceae bacterium]
MGQVSIKIRGRNYQVACEDGQEDHLNKLGLMLDDQANSLIKRTGPVSDSLLLVMVALLLGDKVEGLAQELEATKKESEVKYDKDESYLLTNAIDRFASKINSVADKLNIK